MYCPEILQQLKDFLEGTDFHPAQTAQIKEHLARCEDCRLWWRVAARFNKRGGTIGTGGTTFDDKAS